jgi:hypothetical protein
MNYRAVNARSKKDIYLLLLIFKILEQLGKIKVFTKFNVRNAFHCHGEDQVGTEAKLTAITVVI